MYSIENHTPYELVYPLGKVPLHVRIERWLDTPEGTEGWPRVPIHPKEFYKLADSEKAWEAIHAHFPGIQLVPLGA